MKVNVVFSEHAEKQMVERNLSKSLIIRALEFPDKTILQSVNRRRAQKLIWKSGRKYLLIVVYDKFNNTMEGLTH